MRKQVGKKRYYLLFIGFVFVWMMISWEFNRSDAALAEGAIPQESIRLRILANSDSAADQLVKRQIRDKIVDQMNSWVKQLESPQSLEQARAAIKKHLPEIKQLVWKELKKRKLHYGYDVMLGTVAFPTKMYGNEVYPAGDYEALRITLGKGEGQNWWCVLFPPLCFIDGVTGEGTGAALQADQEASIQQVSSAGGSDAPMEGKAEVRFFLWDWLVRLFDFIVGLFS